MPWILNIKIGKIDPTEAHLSLEVQSGITASHISEDRTHIKHFACLLSLHCNSILKPWIATPVLQKELKRGSETFTTSHKICVKMKI